MAQSCHLKPAAGIPGASAEEVSQVADPGHRPSRTGRLRLKGGFHDIFFLTTLDKTPGFITAMSDLAQRSKYPVEDIGVYIQAIVQGTSCHCEFNLYYDPDKPAELDGARQLVSEGAGADVKDGGLLFPALWGVERRRLSKCGSYGRYAKED